MGSKKKETMIQQTKKYGGKTYKLGGSVRSKKGAERHKKTNNEKGILTRVQKIARGNYVIWERKK